MTILTSTVQPSSDSFKENRASMFELIDHWRGLEQRTIDASNKRLKTFKARGQLSPRERLERLLDPGMPFYKCTPWRITASKIPIVRPASPALLSLSVLDSLKACDA